MNPITNAKIVSVDTDPGVYHRTRGGDRGKPDFIMSNSEIKRFAECPQKWLLGGYDKPGTESQDWGNLVDCLTLTRDRFDSAFAVPPENCMDSKGNTKKWDYKSADRQAWKAEQKAAGKIVVSPEDVWEAGEAVKRLYDDPEIGFLLRNSQKQVFAMGEYRDTATGLVVPVKVLIDIMPTAGLEFYGKCLGDLKTDKDARTRGWPRKVYFYGLQIQAALYLDVEMAATGEDRTDFLHAISESEPPYEPNSILLTSGSDMDFVEIGREAYLNALKFYCRCLKGGHWPGYAEMSDQRIHGWAVVQPEPWMIVGGTVMPPATEPDEESDEPKMDKNDIMP